MKIIPYLDFHPKVSEHCSSQRWVSIIGRTTIGERCHFEDLVTLRADGEAINVGSECWFGEYATVHIADSTHGAILGNHVTVGRFGLVHGCTIAEDCLLGEHAVVMDNANVGKGSVICSDSVVPTGKQLEPGWLYQGVPAKPIRKIEPDELEQLRDIVKSRKSGSGAEWVLSKNPVAGIKHEPGQGIPEHAGDDFYIAPTAAVVGHLEIAAESSIWFGVEIAAKNASVSLGTASNIQDNSRITLDPGEHLKIGKRVTIGHNVRLNACDIGDNCIIGMGSSIGKGTIVQNRGVVAAGAVTTPNTVVIEGMIWSGNPARQSRPLSDENTKLFSFGVDVYKQYAKNYKKNP
ncbi:MAG: gamma carbonic anhydrase family protein [Proteobacteria bacterium]|nr:gamma carbonic anhydrase family protein [Pseudomonadota bacterium]